MEMGNGALVVPSTPAAGVPTKGGLGAKRGEAD